MSKSHLSITQLEMYQGCGERYRRRYPEGEKIPPGVVAIVGRATDSSVTANLQSKIDTDVLLSLDTVQDIARDTLNSEWTCGVLLDAEETSRGSATVRGDAVDKAVRLSSLHAKNKAPELRPTHVQRQWALEVSGGTRDLVGVIDIQEGSMAVRDTKTKSKSPPRTIADTSDQLTMYALAVQVLDGAPPSSVMLDCLIDLKRGAVVRTYESRRTADDFRPLLARIANAVAGIEAGVFIPCSQDHWGCNPKWCGYFDTCPYARRRVAVAIDGAKDG